MHNVINSCLQRECGNSLNNCIREVIVGVLVLWCMWYYRLVMHWGLHVLIRNKIFLWHLQQSRIGKFRRGEVSSNHSLDDHLSHPNHAKHCYKLTTVIIWNTFLQYFSTKLKKKGYFYSSCTVKLKAGQKSKMILLKTDDFVYS